MRWLGVLVLLAAALGASCATSAAGDECGDASNCPSGQDCVGGACVDVPDASTSIDAQTTYPDSGEFVDADLSDAPDLAGFGEPCDDKSECESDICIFVGVGGICTELCAGGSCPDEYGCFGVLGIIEPGVVADVCVPESTQLCTTCAEHTECSIIGQDLCLEYPDGKKFCGRDCSTVECPVGYSCEEVTIGIETYDQCIPLSGACDCDADNEDATEPCSIDTPFGTCAGTRTCLGAAGWSDCEPPSPTDIPDASFTDDNCDGIDGDIDGGIFVARDSGTDDSTCGLVYTDPCATISQGLLRSISEGRNYIYVQASGGDYTEVIGMVVGKHIYGGFDTNWQRDDHSDPAHRVTIVGGFDSAANGGDDQYLTVRAHGWNLGIPTTIADVVIKGPDAVGSDASGGRSSYAVHVASANLDLERVTIDGGNGAVGSTGTAGSNAPSLAAAPGGTQGEPAAQLLDCDTSSAGVGGNPGDNSCSGAFDPDGGKGGKGGPIDTDCNIFDLDLNAQDGQAGNSADYSPGTYGDGGAGGPGLDDDCTPGYGRPGHDGMVTNGDAGTSGPAGGFLSGEYWYAFSGGNGGIGDNGTGGGGGGGSGGCDIGNDSYGAGGGGGGSGGCMALSGGVGGLGGGGSFGLFAYNATVTASDCTINRGIGATGGVGGTGGRGQPGGDGGPGGLASDDSMPGGDGGNGGHGGHGGGGGGGAGGIAAGVYSYGSSVTQDCVVSLGSAGGGGAGGVSAPGATGLDDDGNDGQTGTSGTLIQVGTCSNPNGC